MPGIDDAEVGTFEPHDEREELVAAFAQVVAERGYEHATVATIVERARMDQARFDRYFADLPDCMGQALDVFTDRCFSALTQGFLATPGTWADAAYGAFEAFFRFCVGSPAFLYAVVVELPYGGQAALAHRARIHALLTDLMQPALMELAPEARPAGDEQVFAQMVCGGMWEVFRTYAEENRIAELMDALPWVAFVELAPLVGHREALRVVNQSRAHPSTN